VGYFWIENFTRFVASRGCKNYPTFEGENEVGGKQKGQHGKIAGCPWRASELTV
jgi:hypothetical protein